MYDKSVSTSVSLYADTHFPSQEWISLPLNRLDRWMSISYRDHKERWRNEHPLLAVVWFDSDFWNLRRWFHTISFDYRWNSRCSIRHPRHLDHCQRCDWRKGRHTVHPLVSPTWLVWKGSWWWHRGSMNVSTLLLPTCLPYLRQALGRRHDSQYHSESESPYKPVLLHIRWGW